MKHLLLVAGLALAPAAGAASTVFEATPTDPGGAFDIAFPAGSSLGPDPQSQFVGNIFGGAGFAISGPENFSGRLASGGLMTGLRFEIYEPTTPQKLEGCNATCVDSAFTLTLRLGGVDVVSFPFFPADDIVQGVEVAPGFFTFDEFVVTETAGGNDNEFFANFEATLAPIPLPAGGALLIGALGALALARRRKG